jgi:branched-chain amino acid transport system substrate-binding protein
MKKKMHPWLILILALSLVLTACSSSEGTSSSGENGKVEEVTIGILYPTSGESARIGTVALNAAKLAAEDINAAGGIKSLGGAKVKLEIMDPGSKLESARSAAENLLQNEDVSVLVGAYTSALSMVVSEVTERREVPFVTFSISDELTSRGFKYLFQVAAKGSQFGKMQVEFAKNLVDTSGLTPKVAIVFENTAYGQSTSSMMKEIADEMGFEVALVESFENNSTDAGPLVTKIKSSGASILFPVAYLQDSITIQKTIKQMGVDILTVAGGAGYLMPDFYEAMGKDAEGVTSVAFWNQDVNKPGNEQLSKKYKETYGEIATEVVGGAYSSVWAAALAIDQAGSTDPNKVRDALDALKIEEGHQADVMPGGPIEFDDKGWNSNTNPVMIQWQDGEPRTVYPEADASVELIK